MQEMKEGQRENNIFPRGIEWLSRTLVHVRAPNSQQETLLSSASLVHNLQPINKQNTWNRKL
jgi:hypothetical protein